MHYFIGWDVGGWNCDKNANSRDAIVILNSQRQVIGLPWRGNLRELINKSNSAQAFIAGLFELCDLPYNLEPTDKVLLAIDTPLAFSSEFIQLITEKRFVTQIDDSASNPYLFRYTERFLFKRGLKPLSSIKDMIGSQSTKGMHVLAKFMPTQLSCGVWSDGEGIKALEAYPSACKRSKTVNELLRPYLEKPAQLDSASGKHVLKPIKAWRNADEFDALNCALVAWLQENQIEKVVQPDTDAPLDEGWIFVPLDSLQKSIL